MTVHLGERARLWAGALTLATLALSGCSSSSPEPAEPAARGALLAEMQQRLANGPSDLMRSVLADSWVDDAELGAARDGFRACLVGKHPEVDVRFPEGGGKDIGPYPAEADGSAALDRDVDECARDLDPIETFYRETRSNPEGLTRLEMIRRCFEEHDVPDGAGLPDAELAALLWGDTTTGAYEPESDYGKACVMSPDDVDRGLAMLADPAFEGFFDPPTVVDTGTANETRG